MDSGLRRNDEREGFRSNDERERFRPNDEHGSFRRNDDPKKNGETRVPILVIAEGFALRCCDTSARWRASAVCADGVLEGLRGNPERVTEIAR
jgi:hypothetical protein